MIFSPLLKKKLALPVPPAGAVRIYVVFNVTGAMLLNPLIQGQPAPNGYEWAQYAHNFREVLTPEYRHVLVLDIKESVAGNVVIPSSREYPELARVVYERPGEVFVREAPAGEPCLDTIDLADGRWETGDPADSVPSVREYLAELERRIEALPTSDGKQASRFFFNLDRQTEGSLRGESLPADSNLIAAVNNLGTAVLDRLENKVQIKISTKNPCHEGILNPSGQQFLHDAFLKMLRDYMPGMPGDRFGFDLALVERAFERFANGELRLQLTEGSVAGMWTTQPSSGFYALFAQLALLAARGGDTVSSAAWEQLANVMVRTQEIFAANYTPDNLSGPGEEPCGVTKSPAGYRMEDYCGCNFTGPKFDRGRIMKLTKSFAGDSLDRLDVRAADMALRHFPGTFAHVQPCSAPCAARDHQDAHAIG